jgi:xanthine dehydrogenase molybdopterin-binding subunit B
MEGSSETYRIEEIQEPVVSGSVGYIKIVSYSENPVKCEYLGPNELSKWLPAENDWNGQVRHANLKILTAFRSFGGPAWTLAHGIEKLLESIETEKTGRIRLFNEVEALRARLEKANTLRYRTSTELKIILKDLDNG